MKTPEQIIEAHVALAKATAKYLGGDEKKAICRALKAAEEYLLGEPSLFSIPCTEVPETVKPSARATPPGPGHAPGPGAYADAETVKAEDSAWRPGPLPNPRG